MNPFRKNVAIAIDGGGIRGVVITRALSHLEDHLGKPVRQIFQLTAGTSTGSIISAAIGAGLTAKQMHELYISLGDIIFQKTLRSKLWLLLKYRYPLGPLTDALKKHVGDFKMGDFWTATPPIDVVIPCFDLVENRSRFVKPWKAEYADWPMVKAVLASSSVPTFFPAVEDRFVDGGVGSYANPCYLAAYEAVYCLHWEPAETTLLSFGTGRFPQGLRPGQANKLMAWQWLDPVLGAFGQSADTQQVHLTATMFPGLDFRRFQVDLRENIGMDGADKIPDLITYGDALWQKMLNDESEAAPDFRAVGAGS
jgi:predicted acylesterase/phospholipase RssA